MKLRQILFSSSLAPLLALFEGVTVRGAEPLSVGSYEIVTSTRVSRTLFDYDIKASLTSTLSYPVEVTATVQSTVPTTTILENVLEFGTVPPNSTVPSLDTFKIRQDRTVAFDPDMLVWTFSMQTDSDGDGMPDSWELQFGLNPNDPSDANLDADGDGFTNLQEYWAGTNPTDSRSALRITATTIDNSDGIVSFSSVIGKTYTVEYNDDFPAGLWEPLLSSINGTGASIDERDFGRLSAPNRVYRIKTSGPAGHEVLSELAGFRRLTLSGNSDTVVSLPFTRPAAEFASITGISGNVVQVSGAPSWTPNQWVYASGSQNDTYYALIRSGALEGESFTVTGNGTDTLTLDLGGGSLSGVNPGDAMAIIPYWTLGTVFPSGLGINASDSPADRKSELLFPDISGTGINLSAARTYYFWNGAWRQAGQGGAVKDDDVILPDMYFWIRQNSPTSTDLIARGSVLPTRWRLFLRREPGNSQDNFVALPRALSFSLDSSRLFESGAVRASSSPANLIDELFTFDNSVIAKNKAAAAAYYYWSGAWRKIGAGATDVGSDLVFTPGSGVILRSGPASSAAIWTNERGY